MPALSVLLSSPVSLPDFARKMQVVLTGPGRGVQCISLVLPLTIVGGRVGVRAFCNAPPSASWCRKLGVGESSSELVTGCRLIGVGGGGKSRSLIHGRYIEYVICRCTNTAFCSN